MAKVAVGLGVVRPEVDRSAERVNGLRQLPRFPEGFTEMTVGLSRVRLERDGLAIGCDRFIQPPGLVVREREFNGLLEVRVWNRRDFVMRTLPKRNASDSQNGPDPPIFIHLNMRRSSTIERE